MGSVLVSVAVTSLPVLSAVLSYYLLSTVYDRTDNLL